jgi:hypothetical protein
MIEAQAPRHQRKRDLALWWMDRTYRERCKYPQWLVDRYDRLCINYLNAQDHLEWARRGSDVL